MFHIGHQGVAAVACSSTFWVTDEQRDPQLEKLAVSRRHLPAAMAHRRAPGVWQERQSPNSAEDRDS